MTEVMKQITAHQIRESTPLRKGHRRDQYVCLPSAPYPGLRPFREEEWPIFFGREKITEQMIERLTDKHIIVIHGSSGCGKSSFVRAGVLPHLARECAREGLEWKTATMRPGNSPLWNLADALTRVKEDSSAASIAQVRSVRQQLNNGREALVRIAKDIRPTRKHEICILLDQFEELFRFAKEIGLEEAELFAEAICGFAERPPSGVHLIITIRSDHLGDCSQFHRLAEVINRSQYLLPRLSDDDLIRAIREPAVLYGGHVSLDLAMKLLRDSDGEIDALPLVQHCLMRMWQHARRQPETIGLDRYDGLCCGLSSHADEIVKGIVHGRKSSHLRPNPEATIEMLFRALTAIDANGRHIRQPQTFAHLMDITGLDPTSLNELLAPFRAKSAGFLVPQGEVELKQQDIVDISHEALIRHWTRLTGSASHPGWIRAESEDGQLYRALLEILPGPLPTNTARKWIDRWRTCKPNAAWASRYGGGFRQVEEMLDKTKRRRWRWRVAGLLGTVGVVLLITCLSFFVGYQRDLAARQKLREGLESAQFARAFSLASIGEQVLARDGPTKALLIALEGLINAKNGGDLPTIPKTERLTYRALQDLREKYIVPGEKFSSPQVIFSPDSDRLVIVRAGRTIQFLDTKTGEIVDEEQLKGAALVMATKWLSTTAGTMLALVGQDGARNNAILMLDLCSGNLAKLMIACGQRKEVADRTISAVIEGQDFFRAVSPDGRYALSGGGGAADTRLWDLQTKQVVKSLPRSLNAAFNPEGQLFALALYDRVLVFDLETLTPDEFTDVEMSSPNWRMIAFAFGPENTPAAGKLFTCTGGVARLWDIKNHTSEVLPPPQSNTFQAAFSPTGDSVAATLDNGAVQVWHWQPDRSNTFLLQGARGFVFSVDFSRDGQLIATGSSDGTARVWQLRGLLQPEITIVEPPAPELGRDSKDVISGTRVLQNKQGILSVRDSNSQEPFINLNRIPHKWTTYNFVDDGVSAITEDGQRYVWRVFANAAELASFAQDHLPLCGGRRLILGNQSRAILLGLNDSTSQGATQVAGGNQIAPPREANLVIPQSTCGYPLFGTEAPGSD
jgi:WD40 repeat protein